VIQNVNNHNHTATDTHDLIHQSSKGYVSYPSCRQTSRQMMRHVEGCSMLELCGLQCSLGDGKTVESRMSAHRMIPAKITIIVIYLGISDSRNNYLNDIKAEPGHYDQTLYTFCSQFRLSSLFLHSLHISYLHC
jgi:hypothetical protein